MRRLASTMVIALAAAASLEEAGSAEADDPPTAPDRPDIHSFATPDHWRLTRVDLDLDVDFEHKQLRGSATLAVERQPNCPDGAPLVLDTRDLTIEAVQSGGAEGAWEAVPFGLGPPDPILGSSLSIRLPEGSNRVRVRYQTSPSAGALQWLDPLLTAGGRKPFLFSQSQAIQARTWIPIQDSPGVRLTYGARLRTPDDLRAVMSADQVQDGATGPGRFAFEMPQPIPAYLIALAVGDLDFRPLGPRTGVYAEPSMVDRAADEFADTEAMVHAVEARFGPYRWGRYDLLVLPPSFPFGGMENPKLTFATPTILAGDRSLVALVAHELAHSWSGNLVTNATWSDLYLNEGFTVYLERRIVEDLYGPDRAAMEAVLGLQELREELDRLDDGDEILHLDLAGRDPDDGMTRVPYEKGALFLTTLEHAFGRTRFDAFLKAYFDHFAFRSIATAEFEGYLRENLFKLDPEAAASIDLHAWLHEPGLPTGFPVPESERLATVESTARRWLSGAMAADRITDADRWSTHEWLHFLRSLPETLPADRLAELDAAFGLTDRGNSEIAHQWLLMAVRAGYAPADARLEAFLTSIGRRKFLMPLYGALLKAPAGRARAEAIYAQARPTYHPIAVDSVDKLLGRP